MTTSEPQLPHPPDKRLQPTALGAIFAIALNLLAVFGSTAWEAPSPQDVRNRKGPPASAADDLNSRVATSPDDLRDGTATLDQIEAWMAREWAAPGEPRWVIDQPDLDSDGTADLVVADDRFTGTGGRNWQAFVRTPRGFRYIGELASGIRPLPAFGGHPRVVMAGHISAGEVGVALAELRDDGLHRLASAVLAAGDQGTAEGNRLFNELMLAPTVSVEVLRMIFGSQTYPESRQPGHLRR